MAEPAAAAGRVAVVPATFGWDDVGDFASLAALVPATGDAVSVIGDSSLVVAREASGLVIPDGGRVVVVVGVDDVVVVDTPDALLVVARDQAQSVKAVVDELTARSRADLT